MDPTRGQDSSPQSGRTPQGDKILVHKVNGPHKGQKLTQVHNVDEPYKRSIFSPQSGRTLKNKLLDRSQSRRTPRGYTIRPIHKVDEHMFQKMR